MSLPASEISVVPLDLVRKGKIPSDFYFLASIRVERDSLGQPVFTLGLPENNSVTKSKLCDPFFIVRSFRNKQRRQLGVPMEVGDIIKLGRIQYTVLQYKNNKGVISLRDNFFLQNEASTFVAPDQNVEGTCKFCLHEEQTEGNELITPCNCKGSCQLVHIMCLRNWIFSKIIKKSKGTTSEFNFSKFHCQICGFPFPLKIVKCGRETRMFSIEKPDKPYLVLEAVEHDNFETEHILFLIQPQSGSVIQMGRQNSSQIHITDISVSRLHAIIRYQQSGDGQFLLYDSKSKFGTLVKAKGPQQLREEGLALQVGRTVLSFAVRRDVVEQHKAPLVSRDLGPLGSRRAK